MRKVANFMGEKQFKKLHEKATSAFACAGLGLVGEDRATVKEAFLTKLIARVHHEVPLQNSPSRPRSVKWWGSCAGMKMEDVAR